MKSSSATKDYDPRAFVAETNLIFVSLNFRVGMYGFLYLNHTNAPGNQG